MTDYKVMPVEPTLDMLCEGMDVYGSEDCAEADVLGVYQAIRSVAPAINIVATKNEQGQIVSVTLQDEDHRILEVIAEANVQGELIGYIRRSALELMKNDELGVRANIIKEPRYQDCVALYTALQPSEQQPALTKYQPCGCVICTCEHETQCQGCGAQHCGTHPVGQIPGPIYQQPAPDVKALVEALQKEATSLCDAVESINDLPPAMYALQAGAAVNKVRDAVAALAANRKQGGGV